MLADEGHDVVAGRLCAVAPLGILRLRVFDAALRMTAGEIVSVAPLRMTRIFRLLGPEHARDAHRARGGADGSSGLRGCGGLGAFGCAVLQVLVDEHLPIVGREMLRHQTGLEPIRRRNERGLGRMRPHVIEHRSKKQALDVFGAQGRLTTRLVSTGVGRHFGHVIPRGQSHRRGFGVELRRRFKPERLQVLPLLGHRAEHLVANLLSLFINH